MFTIDPCEKLKNLLDPAKANIKPLIEHGMYEHINNNPSGEGGINLKRDELGNLSSEPSPYTNTNMANIKTGGTYYAGIHSHPKDTYPMFSWSDIYVLYKLEMNTVSFNNKQSSLLLVCEDDNGVKQTYAIVFENVGSMIEAVLNDSKFSGCTPQEICKKLDEEIKDKYDNEADQPSPNYERAFLQFNFGTNIGLYKANTDLTNWSKLSIITNSDNATVTPNNCN